MSGFTYMHRELVQKHEEIARELEGRQQRLGEATEQASEVCPFPTGKERNRRVDASRE
jgi:hypothetical protein